MSKRGAERELRMRRKTDMTLEEIKEFLVGYAKNQRLFNDGSGWIENNSDINIDSKDGSEWLFACAYYKKK